jgi:hypothetical protein
MRKKGYFFTMDALLAILMFTLVITLIHLFYINSPPLIQLHYLSQDTIDILGDTKVNDMHVVNPGYRLNGGIQYSTFLPVQNPNNQQTILEQMKVFHNADGNYEARVDPMGNQLFKHLYPTQYNFRVRFGAVEQPEASKIVVVSRRVVGGVQTS